MRWPRGFLVAALAGSPAAANPVITEVAWMGSDAPQSGQYEEWVEIYNAGLTPIDTEEYALIQGATVRPLPVGTLEPGGFLVLERQNYANATPLEPPVAVPFGFGTGLLNAPSATNPDLILCLCPAGTAVCAVDICDVANLEGGWPAGTSSPKRTMERIDPALDGALDSSWQTGTPSSPGALSPAPPIDAGPPDAGASPEDAGAPIDGGDATEDAGARLDGGVGGADAGFNTAPIITVLEPSSPVTGPQVTVTWMASDPDPTDFVTVDLYWSLDTEGQDGTRFARGLAGGDGAAQSTQFDTNDLSASRVHVLAVARDSRGGTAYAYAPGPVTVVGGSLEPATLRVTEPDGVNDEPSDGAAFIAWELTLPDDSTGTVTLFLNDDGEGEGGIPIQGGLSASADGPRAFRLPLEGLAPGEHHVYAVLDYATRDGRGRVVSYADGTFVVPRTGGCIGQGSMRSSGLLALATLVILSRSFRPKTPFPRTRQRRGAQGP